MIEESDGMGDGEGGNEMCVIGTPVDGGSGTEDTVPTVVS
jgi:hypothetical protein